MFKGDEGKGAIVDMLGLNYDMIVAQGGHNAGPTIWVDGVRYAPTLTRNFAKKNIINIIGNGVVFSRGAHH